MDEVWQLALSVARAEAILRRLLELSAPWCLVEQKLQQLAKRRQLLEATLRGVELLPLARKFVQVEMQRERIFNSSLFGQLKEAMEGLLQLYHGNTGETQFHKEPFQGLKYNEYWKKFRQGLEQGDSLSALEALWDFLSWGRAEFLHLEFPTFPYSLVGLPENNKAYLS